MTIIEFIEELNKIKDEYGEDLLVLDADGFKIDLINVNKYIVISGRHGRGLLEGCPYDRIQTEDLDSDIIKRNIKEGEFLKSEGLCVTIC